MNRYIVGFLATVGIIVLIIILIVRSLVSGPSSNPVAQNDLTSYAGTSTTVQYTIDSPVTSAQTHHDIFISIGNYQAALTVTEGYDGSVVRTQSYPMSTSSYATFLRALKYNGFDQGDNSTSNADERGQCALGDRFIYQVIDSSGNDIQRYWSTTCGTGTFHGSASTIRTLFQKQIPDYNKLTSDIPLGGALTL